MITIEAYRPDEIRLLAKKNLESKSLAAKKKRWFSTKTPKMIK